MGNLRAFAKTKAHEKLEIEYGNRNYSTHVAPESESLPKDIPSTLELLADKAKKGNDIPTVANGPYFELTVNTPAGKWSKFTGGYGISLRGLTNQPSNK